MLFNFELDRFMNGTRLGLGFILLLGEHLLRVYLHFVDWLCALGICFN